jgi:hypothetical protein
MKKWTRSLWAAWGVGFLIFGAACEKKPAPSAPPVPSSPVKVLTPGKKMNDLAEFLNKDASKTGATSERTDGNLPPGHPPIGATPSMMAADQNDEVTPLKYDAPAQWKSQTPSSAMRKAQFLLPRAAGDSEDGQLIVFQFGRGQGGAVEMNIDRWIGMFSTNEGKPLDKESVKRETREVGGLKVTTLDISGRFTDAMMGVSTGAAKDNYRMLSAIVETPEGPWFFKGVGPDATMQSHRDEFAKMLNTVRR